MRLQRYLDDRDMTYSAFARLIGVSVQAVHRYARGERRPRDEIMDRIFDATGGLVQANDFYGIGRRLELEGAA